MAKLQKYYFVYTDSGDYPFDAGWTVVYAHDLGEAVEKFNKRHPPREGGACCWKWMFTDGAFQKNDMYLNGSNGRHEVEIIE